MQGVTHLSLAWARSYTPGPGGDSRLLLKRKTGGGFSSKHLAIFPFVLLP